MFNKQNMPFGKEADFASLTLMKPPSSHMFFIADMNEWLQRKNWTQ